MDTFIFCVSTVSQVISCHTSALTDSSKQRTNAPVLKQARSTYGLKISPNTVIQGFAGQSEVTPAARGRQSSALSGMTLIDASAATDRLVSVDKPVAAEKSNKENVAKPKTPSPKKGASKTDPISPTVARKNTGVSNGSSPAKMARSGC